MKNIMAVVMAISCAFQMQGSGCKDFALCAGAACVGGVIGAGATFGVLKRVYLKKQDGDAASVAAKLELEAQKAKQIQELEQKALAQDEVIKNIQKQLASLSSNSGKSFVTHRAGGVASSSVRFDVSDDEGESPSSATQLLRRSAMSVDTPEVFARAPEGQSVLVAEAASASSGRGRSLGSLGSSNPVSLGATHTIH